MSTTTGAAALGSISGHRRTQWGLSRRVTSAWDEMGEYSTLVKTYLYALGRIK